jgi:DNA-binding NarL/FixJ family response regulator
MTSTIRVLIADDHPVVRGGLAALMSTLDGLEVVAQVGDGEAAVREAVLLRPDVASLDLPRPGGVGIPSMRSRAEELGGTFEAGPADDGWRVHVVLPAAAVRAA